MDETMNENVYFGYELNKEQMINDFNNRIGACIDEELTEEINEELEELEKQLTVQEQLAKYKEIIPISYIARTYYGKSAAWLQQRLYGYKVRGKVYKLSDTDLCTFNNALQDISKRIGSLVITQ